MDYPKKVAGVGLVNGKFVDEDVVNGTPGSLIPASWGNAITDEVLAVIQAAKLDPEEDDLDQLLEAIRYIVQDDTYIKERVYNKEEIDALLMLGNAVPVGMMAPFPAASIPSGFLEVDGSLQSAAAYPDLAAYLGATFNLAGDPAGYFRLPESRGEFLRGWDHGRGVDAGRTLGSYQLDQFKSHSHAQHTRLALPLQHDDTSENDTGISRTEESDQTGLTGGSETRPRNLAVVWCIKAWSTPVNQGNIDVAALAGQVQAFSVNGPVVGSIRKGAMAILSPSATATYTADELVLGTALGGQSYRLASFSKSINLTVTGAGGMDTGTAPVSGFVAIYAIYNPTTKVSALLATNAAVKVSEVYSGGNMPAGYSASCLLTVLPTNASSQFPACTVRERTVHVASVYVYSTQSIVAGVLVTPGTVPANAVSISGTIDLTCTAASQVGMLLLDGETGTGLSSLIGYVTASGSIVCPFTDIHLDSNKRFTVNTSIAGSGTPTYRVATSGYKI